VGISTPDQGELVSGLSLLPPEPPFAVELPGDSERVIAAPSAVAAEREAAGMFMAEVDRHNTAEHFVELPGTTKVVHKSTLVRQVLIRWKKSCDRTIRVQSMDSGAGAVLPGKLTLHSCGRRPSNLVCHCSAGVIQGCCVGDLWWAMFALSHPTPDADNSVWRGFRPDVADNALLEKSF
jgi:hypothetical protein